MVRMSAEERRESVVRAAIAEFSRRGYHGTSTATIAERVGVSQPYLFRLFPNKQAIFLAAARRCIGETSRVLEEAGRGHAPDQAEHSMAARYLQLLAEEPEKLLMQMQVYVAVAAAESAGDHEFGSAMREAWADELYDFAHLRLGADHERTATFMAHGMLINTLVAMGFPAGHRVWEGFWDHSRPGR